MIQKQKRIKINRFFEEKLFSTQKCNGIFVFQFVSR